GYNPKARSPKGAIGLMQLMPDTAQRYKVANIWDPGENVRGGARYLRDLLALFNNDLSLVLAAYNAGEDAVAQYGNKIPPYAETRNYVPRVLQQYQLLSTSRARTSDRRGSATRTRRTHGATRSGSPVTVTHHLSRRSTRVAVHFTAPASSPRASPAICSPLTMAVNCSVPLPLARGTEKRMRE